MAGSAWKGGVDISDIDCVEPTVYLVQQRRGARLVVAVVVVQGDAALVREEDQDARPVHVPAVGTARQDAQRLLSGFCGCTWGDWLLALKKTVLLIAPPTSMRTCGMEPPESASMKRPRPAMAAFAEARMCYVDVDQALEWVRG